MEQRVRVDVTGRRWLLVGGLALAGCAGVVAASLAGDSRNDAAQPESPARLIGAGAAATQDNGLPALVTRAMRLRPSGSRKLRTFRTASSETRELHTATNVDGRACLLDVGPRNVGGGCNADLFGGHELAWTEGIEGGPTPEQMRGLHIVGVAQPSVAAVSVIDSDRRAHSVELGARRTFVYTARVADLRRGVRPLEIVAYDERGSELDRMDVD